METTQRIYISREKDVPLPTCVEVRGGWLEEEPPRDYHVVGKSHLLHSEWKHMLGFSRGCIQGIQRVYITSGLCPCKHSQERPMRTMPSYFWGQKNFILKTTLMLPF